MQFLLFCALCVIMLYSSPPFTLLAVKLGTNSQKIPTLLCIFKPLKIPTLLCNFGAAELAILLLLKFYFFANAMRANPSAGFSFTRPVFRAVAMAGKVAAIGGNWNPHRQLGSCEYGQNKQRSIVDIGRGIQFLEVPASIKDR